MDAGIVQIIVAVIGISGPIVLEYIKLRKTSSSEMTEQQPVGTTTKGKAVSLQLVGIKGDQERNFLDLSIILLYGAFFSAILADSFLKDPVTPTIQKIAETLSPYQGQKNGCQVY